MVITVHHLNNSRSQRVLWLLEELELPYELVKYERDKTTLLAPPSLQAIHPLGKSPVITDGDLTIAETGAIVEYLIETHGAGRLIPKAGTLERLADRRQRRHHRIDGERVQRHQAGHQHDELAEAGSDRGGSKRVVLGHFVPSGWRRMAIDDAAATRFPIGHAGSGRAPLLAASCSALSPVPPTGRENRCHFRGSCFMVRRQAQAGRR